MIDQLPEHRTMPDDVRMRARRRLSEGMSPPARTGRPILIAAGVSMLAAGAVFASQALLGSSADTAAPPMQYNGEFVGKDRKLVNHIETGKVAPDALARCAAAAKEHPPAGQWQPIATGHKNGTVLTAFRAPAGVFFCANTATTTTISAPDPVRIEAGRRKVKILFTTPSGTMAGLVSPDVRFLSLSQIADSGLSTTMPALVDGLFLAPSGFQKAENGTKALVNGEESAVRGVPGPTASVVDRPLPPAARDTPETARFGACLKNRAVPDADQFAHGLTAKVSATDTMITGRFGDLLLYCREAENDPTPGSVYDLDDLTEIRGTTVAAMTAFYDFKPFKVNEQGEYYDGGSTSAAAVGLVLDPRAASITYTSPGAADVPATMGDGTFVLAARLSDRHPDARVVVRDAAGTVLETITPQNPS
ncbi:hypothetical protein SAMN04488074_101830 [Lentzea albidocapillata subsp. violacea]|uniref:Uncharacterized protein n=1 Tax=Lentzea albidocapillata subsp. violacea TaxID=128104 RepID=A0A1G8RYX8_9PSEU|nr:hypothetical protein [Lentzea albidocapillata]SDJ22157.1 hypothetical protein SAMN04488074_101830 [Lentzea albidocapillata subsp. violacea]